MLVLSKSSYNSSCKVDKFLNFVQKTLSGSTPHAEAISYVWKYVSLDENFDSVLREVVTELK